MSGITDPDERYFKDGIWAWAATLWEQLISQGGRLFTALHGWDGAAWRRLPLLWGYTARWALNVTAAAVGAGNATAITGPGDPDYVYRLQQVSINHDAGVNKEVLIRVFTNGVTVALFHDLAVVSGSHYPLSVDMAMHYDDSVQATIITPGAGKSINLRVWGYQMLIAA